MRKYFIIFSLFLLIVSSMGMPCFASNSYEYPDISTAPNISSIYTHHFIFDNGGTLTAFVIGSDDKSAVDGARFEIGRNSYDRKFGILASTGEIQVYKFILISGNWSFSKLETMEKGGWSYYDYFFGSGNYECIPIESSKDIIRKSDESVFFQQTPVTEQTVLTPILEGMEMNQLITTTIIGLAVLLIPLLICLIGFWKAWRLLLKILHKS